jgi:transcription antitermination factor NusG
MTWLVALTEPRAELSAVAAVERLGITAFCPLRKRTVSRRGRRSSKIEALFGGYTFVQFVEAWSSILSLKDVRGVIMAGSSERPQQVSDAAVEAVKSRCDGLGIYRGYQLERFKAGDRVQPQSGPLMSMTGIYKGSPHDGVEVALFELLGAKVRPVEFRHGVLVAAAD